MRRQFPGTYFFLLLILSSSTVFADEQDEYDPRLHEVEEIVKNASLIEKKGDCEAAYKVYVKAKNTLSEIDNSIRANEFDSIIENKLAKLEDCFNECQPTEAQREICQKAEGFSSDQPKRAVGMLKTLLIGKNEKCSYWAETRKFLNNLPGQNAILENDDPCRVPPEINKAILETRNSAKLQTRAVADMLDSRESAFSKIMEIIKLFRDIDETRIELFNLREKYRDCEKIHVQLSGEAETLRGSMMRMQDVIVTAYQTQVDLLARKVKYFQKRLKERDEKIKAQENEIEQLKKQFEELSNFNEEIFSGLFVLAGYESVSFARTPEMQNQKKSFDEIQKLLANESFVIKTLREKYPEYFKETINVDGLKRRKFVIEKIRDVMTKFDRKYGADQGYNQTMMELDATIAMMNKAVIKGEQPKEKDAETGKNTVYLAMAGIVGTIGAGALLVFLKKKFG